MQIGLTRIGSPKPTSLQYAAKFPDFPVSKKRKPPEPHYFNMGRRYLAENEAIGVMLSVPKPLAMVLGMALPRKPSNAKLRNKFRGCLLGGAVGDALGAPVEFLHLDEIEQVYGKQGIRDYAPAYGKIGAITDDRDGAPTQSLDITLRAQQPFLTARDQTDQRATLRERLCGCAANAARCAGNNYNLRVS